MFTRKQLQLDQSNSHMNWLMQSVWTDS